MESFPVTCKMTIPRATLLLLLCDCIKNTIQRFDWPAQSLNLKHIEHFSDELDRRMRFPEMRPASIARLLEIFND